MTRLPVFDVALEGFRLTRERPVAVLTWGVLIAVAQAATLALLVASGAGEGLAAFQRGGATADPATAMALLSAAFPGLLLTGGVGLLLNAVVYAAVLRAVLRRTPDRFAFLRLGPDELRLLGVLIALLLVAAAAVAVLVPMLTLLVTPLTGAGAMSVAAPLVLALAFAAMSYPLVRLSPAPAMTVAEGRFALLRAWPLTAGVFWPLLAANVLAISLGAVVSVLVQVLAGALWALASGGSMASAATALQADAASLQGALAPGSLAALALSGVTTGFVAAIVAAPGPAAYRALTGRGLPT